MASYRLVATRVVTGGYLCDLPWRSLQFSEVLNGSGQLTATVTLDSSLTPQILAAQVAATEPWTCALWVLRDGNLVWGGPILTRPFDLSSYTMQVTANDWWDYMAHVDLGGYSATGDVLTVARAIIAQGLGKTGVPSYLRAPVPTACGHSCTVEYLSTDYRFVGEVIGELTQQETPLGFDFTVQPEVVGGVYGCAFPLWWPERAPTGEATFTWPGNMVNLAWPQDGAQQATDLRVLGAGDGPTQKYATATSAQRGVTLPRLYRVDQHTNQNSQTALNHLASGGITVAEAPMIAPRVSVGPGQTPYPGTYHVGQTARVRVNGHPFFPYGLDATARITKVDTSVTQDGVESATVDLAQPVVA